MKKFKSQNKLKASKKTKSPKEYTEALLEDINAKFDVVIEGHQLLDHKIDGKIDALDKKVMEGFEIVDQRFNAVDQELETIKGELGLLRYDLKQKIDREEFKFLEARVARLETARKKT
ncbi:MAG: Heptapeptide repeat protein [Parcubacteria group bacterium GW2011_GWA2_40_8]|nr:MAG: Heptapeptide repeat protein [Parcubacteria group bacterium GW2011_GWB1_40_14]KKR77423.1 MAG: Heptapeptide repeat protein [Parcubacteria group bacterium GW2011_GWA2_40_8]